MGTEGNFCLHQVDYDMRASHQIMGAEGNCPDLLTPGRL
jgi:hypothetical protein